MIRIMMIEGGPASLEPTISVLYLPAVPDEGDVIPGKRLDGSMVRYQRTTGPAVFHGTTVAFEVFELDEEAAPWPWFCPIVEGLGSMVGDGSTVAKMRRP